MKKIIILLLVSIVAYSQQQTVSYSINPAAFDETTAVTIAINGNSINEGTWSVTGNALYLWTWSFDINDTNIIDCPSNGTWTNSNETNKFTYNLSTDTYSYTFNPSTFYARSGIGRIGFLVKAKNGTGDKKSQDIYAEVGLFQTNLTSPANQTSILSAGSSLSIAANNTNGNASYNLKANGVSINAISNVTSYSFIDTNISSNRNYELEITQGATTQIKKFNVVVNPGVVSEALLAGLEDGINYNNVDATKATLVLDAPNKDFVYVAGSFNNWQPNANYAMKKDPATGKFWLELTGLVPQENNTYQYWVVDETPIANSPVLVKTADPFSTLVLSPFDDPEIPAGTYPNLPTYPAGQEREVTVLQTGQTPYPWINNNFSKPKKEDLVVYEVLIRDFDANRNFQDLINRIDYFKNLKINAIQLMPIMEFEGNKSWGYNTAFHMALDKYYGTSNKLKEFVDLCHANGIAVILDIALNHAFGRNPMVRMWMNDADKDGWGEPSTENPYFNTIAKHSYNVGSDFNHSTTLTKNYVKKVVKHWIQEYKIDGFRWDLTKGFTQACTATDESCTNAYQADRVAILKDYVDYSWNLDPTHYAIFEHLGIDSEEKEWANYRINETPSKGVMMWGETTSAYSQLLGGYAANGDISRIGHTSHAGFIGKRVIGFPESHDKERIMYTALTTGNSAGTAPVLNNLNNALARMSAIGAASILVPGPKMIWHFADLGMQNSIYACSNGTVNTETDPIAGNCKLDTKLQPQWIENWLTTASRSKIYNDWSKIIALKINEPVFEGEYSISPDGNNVKQRIYVFDNTLPSTQLKNAVILCNFSVSNITINPNFPYTGTWYNLMDNSAFEVTTENQNTPILIPSGQFLIYGNKPSSVLNTDDFEFENTVLLMPNPAKNEFKVSQTVSNISIYNITGQLVKNFNDNTNATNLYSIADLNKGVYLVKITNNANRSKVIKLIKE
jgi:hypothetical protein